MRRRTRNRARISREVLLRSASRGVILVIRRCTEPRTAVLRIPVSMSERSYSDVGGTPGGLGQFLFGLAMACFGGYLLLHQVTVQGGFWGFYGPNTFGLSMVPLLIGVAMLFFDGRSRFGWLL